MRQWWAGLAPGDRRTAGVFMGVIVGTLPVYMVLLTLISLSAPPRVESQVVVSPGPSVVLPPSPSPAPTETPSPSATPSQTETPLPSATPSATGTASPMPSPTPMELPSPVSSPASTPVGGGAQATPTRTPTEVRRSPTPTPRPQASPTRQPTAQPTARATPEPECESLPGVAVPGQFFDILEVRAPRLPGGEVVVEGTVRNNCDRPLSGVVRVQALNEQGRVVAEEESRIGTVRPDGRASFRVALGRVQGVVQIRAVAEPR